MALDVGEVRTGLALSDVTRTQATPLSVLDTRELCRNNKPLLDLITDYEVTQLVVGLPLSLDGSPGSQARRVQSLTKQLLFGLDALPHPPKVVRCDERHSSVRATERGHALGLSERAMRGRLDSHAAAEFLQDFLDDWGNDPENCPDNGPDNGPENDEE